MLLEPQRDYSDDLDFAISIDSGLHYLHLHYLYEER